MKIAVALFKYFSGGGLQNDILNITKFAASKGHDITIFCIEWDGAKPDWCKVELLPVKSLSNHGKALEFGKLFHDAIRGKNFERTFACNRIAGCDWYFAADSCYAASFRKKHSVFAKLLPRYRTFLKLENDVFSKESNTKIMYLCEAQKKEFQEYYGTPDSRFFFVPPGIDERFFQIKNKAETRREKRKELGISDDDFMIITVAANPKLKGADRVARAINSLPDELKKKCRYFVTGDFNMPPAVNLGKRNDIPELLAAADIMAHPARSEAAGNALAEAIAAGTPVICSGLCGYADYVKNSGGIVLSEPFSQNEFNAALKNAVLNPPQCFCKDTSIFRGRAEYATKFLTED